MECKRMNVSVEQMLDPEAPQWTSIPAEAMKMSATPLANQPSEYIKASRDEKKIGKVTSLNVQSVHNGTDIFFRLSWEDAEQNVQPTDNNVFPDGCGILMPINPGEPPPLDEMGKKDAPVNAWFWRADLHRARNIHATGLSTTTPSAKAYVHAKAAWHNGTWAVVFARPLEVHKLPKESVQLAAGKAVRIGFAVWEGGNGERGGLKSFSKEWRELTLEA